MNYARDIYYIGIPQRQSNVNKELGYQTLERYYQICCISSDLLQGNLFKNIENCKLLQICPNHDFETVMHLKNAFESNYICKIQFTFIPKYIDQTIDQSYHG